MIGEWEEGIGEAGERKIMASEPSRENVFGGK